MQRSGVLQLCSAMGSEKKCDVCDVFKAEDDVPAGPHVERSIPTFQPGPYDKYPCGTYKRCSIYVLKHRRWRCPCPWCEVEDVVASIMDKNSGFSSASSTSPQD